MNVLLIVVVCTLAAIVAVTESRQISVHEFGLAENRIINGSIAHRGQFPYIVGICTLGIPYCAGSILSPYWVLTAAHCFPNGYKQSGDYYIDVVAGLLIPREVHPDVQTVKAEEAFNHPDFNYDIKANDISMLKLTSPLRFTEVVKPIPLAHQQQEIFNQHATTPGWGLSQPDDDDNTHALLYFSAPLYHSADCEQFFIVPDKNTTLCTRISGQSTCNGDSGGPLEQNGILIGIVSVGGTGCIDTPSIYTRVSSFTNFIRECMDKH